jgi:hypothetical protein
MMSAQLQQQQQQQQPPDGDALPAAEAPATAHAPGLSDPTHDTDASTVDSLQNRAGESKSPYVRKHADSPVAWQPLDEATIERATRENKPIFMHLGFLADHRESGAR